MSTDFVPQPQNDDRFLEEAIDLLLFLEQELPNYTKDSNPATALALMEAASSLHSIAIAAELDAIAIVAAALEEIFQLLHQYRAIVNAPIASLLSEGLDCLQMLLMAFLTASQIDEVEILERMSAIVAHLQAEFGDSQETNLETSIEQPQECEKAGEQGVGSRGAGEQGSRGAKESSNTKFFPLRPSAPPPLCPLPLVKLAPSLAALFT